MMPIKAIWNSGPPPLDTQSVTVAQTGSIGDRVRGYDSSPALGSITPGTSAIFGGAAITEMYADEAVSEFYLAITGSSNSGWTTMRNMSNGNSLTRASASFSGGRWTWSGQSLSSFFTNSSGAITVQWF